MQLGQQQCELLCSACRPLASPYPRSMLNSCGTLQVEVLYQSAADWLHAASSATVHPACSASRSLHTRGRTGNIQGTPSQHLQSHAQQRPAALVAGLTSQVREESGLSTLPARSSFTMLCMFVRLLITSSTLSSDKEERLEILAALAVSLHGMFHGSSSDALLMTAITVLS